VRTCLAWSVLLSGCALQPADPVAKVLSTPVSIPLGIAQIGHGREAVFTLCGDCPTPTRKTLAPVPAPLKLAEVPKPKPVVVEPQEERSTRAVHFPMSSAKLTGDAWQQLKALRPSLLEARSIVLTGHTDRVGAPAFNQRLAARRAETVRRALLDLGIPRERITRVEAKCCVEDPPPVNPSARRTDVEILIVRPAP
jgi:outer membrane protein OmpA-like peptidoglycan-associated protein